MSERVTPRNMKEQILFSSAMCFMMVSGMMSYNLALHNSLTWNNVLSCFVPIFLAAYFVDYLAIHKITEVVTGGIASRFSKQKFTKWIFPLVKITFMVLTMSFIALLLEVGIPENLGQVYLKGLARNYLMALTLQLAIAGPVSRKVLKSYQAGY